jgi:tetratricopeptide (TPR) repeat protein
MLFYAICFTIAGISSGAIIVIVARKFPQLTLIDTSALPKERDAMKKKAIIKDRVDRKLGVWGRGLLDLLARPIEAVRNAFRRQYRRVLALDRQLRHRPLDPAAARQMVRELLDQAVALMSDGKLPEAEKKYVEIISLDRKNVLAYRGLGVLYLGNRQYAQAKETLGFLVKLVVKNGCAYAKAAQSGAPDRQRVPEAADKRCVESPAEHAEMAKDNVNLGLTLKAMGEHRPARMAFEGAVLFEPSNPKYLDLLLEACILEGAKERAWEIFDRLREVNPENQKLDSLRERVEQIPELRKEKRRA